MTSPRSIVFSAALCVLAAVAQVLAMQWGLIGDLAGGLLAGGISLTGMRMLALETKHLYLPLLVAVAASSLGIVLGLLGGGFSYSPAFWIAPLLAALPPAVLLLDAIRRGETCDICHAPVRRLLSFSCPRCHLVACENCWQFERNRCHLCETNQIPLFPLDFSWWQDRFGTQVHGSRCALCLRTADWSMAHWACGGCGHPHCRSCWDDNDGRCSRCGWTIPELHWKTSSSAASEHSGRERQTTH